MNVSKIFIRRSMKFAVHISIILFVSPSLTTLPLPQLLSLLSLNSLYHKIIQYEIRFYPRWLWCGKRVCRIWQHQNIDEKYQEHMHCKSFIRGFEKWLESYTINYNFPGQLPIYVENLSYSVKRLAPWENQVVFFFQRLRENDYLINCGKNEFWKKRQGWVTIWQWGTKFIGTTFIGYVHSL